MPDSSLIYKVFRISNKLKFDSFISKSCFPYKETHTQIQTFKKGKQIKFQIKSDGHLTVLLPLK